MANPLHFERRLIQDAIESDHLGTVILLTDAVNICSDLNEVQETAIARLTEQCEIYIKERNAFRKLVDELQPYIKDLQGENYNEPDAGISYDYTLESLVNQVEYICKGGRPGNYQAPCDWCGLPHDMSDMSQCRNFDPEQNPMPTSINGMI